VRGLRAGDVILEHDPDEIPSLKEYVELGAELPLVLWAAACPIRVAYARHEISLISGACGKRSRGPTYEVE
jgi:hypothetical protein